MQRHLRLAQGPVVHQQVDVQSVVADEKQLEQLFGDQLKAFEPAVEIATEAADEVLNDN